MYKLQDINKTYKNKKNRTNALNNINLVLPNKGLIFLLGKSGSGKTTLLNMLGFLDRPTSGNVYYNENKIDYKNTNELNQLRNKEIGFIFQDYNLFDNSTVKDNLELSINLQNIEISNVDLEVALEKVDLHGYENRKIKTLSGGEKQRIAIARALLKNSNVILADEPSGNLDSENEKKIFNILKKVSKEKLVLIVTHDNEIANLYADRILRISDGKIIEDNKINTIAVENNILKETRKTKFKSLPFKYSIKMALNNLFKVKLKLICSLLFLILTFIILNVNNCIALTDTVASFLNSGDESYKGFLLNYDKESNLNDFENLNDDAYYKKIYNHYVIIDKTDMKNEKLSLVYGRLPENKNEFCIDEYCLNEIIENGFENNNVIKHVSNFEEYKNIVENQDFKIVGIIKMTNYSMEKTTLYFAHQDYYETLSYHITASTNLYCYPDTDSPKKESTFYIKENAENIHKKYGHELTKNEIIVDSNTFKNIIMTNLIDNNDYTDVELDELYRSYGGTLYPLDTTKAKEFLDDNDITLTFNITNNNETIKEDFEVVGFADNVIINDALFEQFDRYNNNLSYIYLEVPSNYKNTKALRNIFSNYHNYNYTGLDTEFHNMDLTNKFDSIVALVFFAIAMLFLIFYYKSCYKQNTKDIGIYLSLGAKPKDIVCAYTLQGFIIILLGLIISIPFSFLYLNFLNSTFDIFVFSLHYYNFLLTFGIGIVILVILNIIAYIYYKNKMPIEIIKKY
ncbi:MAG: ABC transporter ATP-binding protein [Clostridia bacterium]